MTLEDIKLFFNQNETISERFFCFITENKTHEIECLDFFNLIQAIMTNHQKLKSLFFKKDNFSSFECLYKIFMKVQETDRGFFISQQNSVEFFF